MIADVFLQAYRDYWNYLVWSFTHFGFYNMFMWIGIACVIGFLLELILPQKFNYPFINRKSYGTDFMFLIANYLLFECIFFFAFCSTLEYVWLGLLKSFNWSFPTLLSSAYIPYWLCFVIAFFIRDLMEYGVHFAQHHIPFLWRFHQIHHNQTTLGFAATQHLHYFDILTYRTCSYIVFAILGFTASEFFMAYFIISLINTFINHCNIPITIGPLKYIINNPEAHHWHHAYNTPSVYGANFGSILNIWDWLFGTLYLPSKDIKPKLGLIDKNKLPNGFLSELSYPFERNK